MIKTKKQVEQDIKEYGYTISLNGYARLNKKDCLEYIYHLDLIHSYIVIYDYEDNKKIKSIASINQLGLVRYFKNSCKGMNFFQKYNYQERSYSIIIIWE